MVEPGDDVQQRGLAGAGASDDRDEVALVYVEGDVLEGVDRLVAHLEVRLTLSTRTISGGAVSAVIATVLLLDIGALGQHFDGCPR